MDGIFEHCKNTKEQGTIGLGKAIAYFTSRGFVVSIPLNDSQDYDLVVDDGTGLKKVQVKTTNQFSGKNGYVYKLNLRILGGNSKMNYVHKTNSQIEYDFLFAVCGNGRMFLIPKKEIQNVENCISLGDVRKQFEIFV